MVTATSGRPVGRPPAPEKTDAIIAVAWSLFLAQGVAATAVEAIAAQAGVSKATLYKHFPDKSALFEACIDREMQRIEAAQNLSPAPAAPAPLEETLRRFGLGILQFLASDPAIDFYNSLSGELRRHQELARSFHDKGPGRTRANLTAILAAAASRGELALDNPAQAAEHLFGLWQGFSNFQLALGIETEAIRTALAARVEAGIAVFLKAYRAAPDS